MRSILIALALCFALPSFADSRKNDYDFNQERMLVDQGEIFVISSFDSSDLLTAFDYYGNMLWEVRFNTKVLSWDVQPNLIFVFSKNRSGNKTFVNCIDRTTGIILWERV